MTTARADSGPADVSSAKPPSTGRSRVTSTPSRTGAPVAAAWRSRYATTSSRCMKPSGSSPSYGSPGSCTVQFGVTSRKLSHHPRHVCPTRPRSRTACGTPASASSWLTDRPACPAPTTTTSKRSVIAPPIVTRPGTRGQGRASGRSRAPPRPRSPGRTAASTVWAATGRSPRPRRPPRTRRATARHSSAVKSSDERPRHRLAAVCTCSTTRSAAARPTPRPTASSAARSSAGRGASKRPSSSRTSTPRRSASRSAARSSGPNRATRSSSDSTTGASQGIGRRPPELGADQQPPDRLEVEAVGLHGLDQLQPLEVLGRRSSPCAPPAPAAGSSPRDWWLRMLRTVIPAASASSPIVSRRSACRAHAPGLSRPAQVRLAAARVADLEPAAVAHAERDLRRQEQRQLEAHVDRERVGQRRPRARPGSAPSATCRGRSGAACRTASRSARACGSGCGRPRRRA